MQNHSSEYCAGPIFAFELTWGTTFDTDTCGKSRAIYLEVGETGAILLSLCINTSSQTTVKRTQTILFPIVCTRKRSWIHLCFGLVNYKLICLDLMGWVLCVPSDFLLEFGPWRLRITKPNWTFAKRTGESEVIGVRGFLSEGKIEDEETGHVSSNYLQVQRYFFGFLRGWSSQRSTFILDLLHPCWSRHAGAPAKTATSCNKAALCRHGGSYFLCASTFMNIHDSTCFTEIPHVFFTSSPRRSTCMSSRVAQRCWAGQPWRRASWKMFTCASLRRFQINMSISTATFWRRATWFIH